VAKYFKKIMIILCVKVLPCGWLQFSLVGFLNSILQIIVKLDVLTSPSKVLFRDKICWRRWKINRL